MTPYGLPESHQWGSREIQGREGPGQPNHFEGEKKTCPTSLLTNMLPSTTVGF
jgi:hypothetical protein